MTPLVVGLGNPGPEYEWTRHNIGYHVAEELVRRRGTGAANGPRHGGALFRTGKELEGYRGPRAFTWARLARPDALVVRPETWMNRSGDVVAPLCEYAGAGPEALMVVYDDMDLDLGRLRIRPHGGAGGHNGMRSIIERLGTDRSPRLRVGIGRPGTDAARHVLERFSDRELVEAQISVAQAADALCDWLDTGDIEGCMTRYHSRWNQEG